MEICNPGCSAQCATIAAPTLARHGCIMADWAAPPDRTPIGHCLCAPAQVDSSQLQDGKCPSLVIDKASLSHSNSRSIGFWMSVEGRTPIQPVRVLVSYEALSQIDPTNVRDLHGALENFDQFRSQVERAASRKFDRYGFDPEKYEGTPAIRLIDVDLT